MIKLSTLNDNVFLVIGDHVAIITKTDYLKNIEDYEDEEVYYQGQLVDVDMGGSL